MLLFQKYVMLMQFCFVILFYMNLLYFVYGIQLCYQYPTTLCYINGMQHQNSITDNMFTKQGIYK